MVRQASSASICDKENDVLRKNQWIITASGSVTLLVALMTGCAPTLSERNWGVSVRQMSRAQIYDPGAAVNPSPDPANVRDGKLGRLIIEAYRGDVAAPQDVKQDITINVGQ